jgi:hypothetical protein
MLYMRDYEREPEQNYGMKMQFEQVYTLQDYTPLSRVLVI